MSSASSSTSKVMYIYNLPHHERKLLCSILDQNDKWEELGGTHMGFDVMMLQELRKEVLRGMSPTDSLLTKWGHRNHTVLELFILLSRMQHYQSMVTLKPFVDARYHRLIQEGEHNLENLINRLQVHSQVRDKNEPCTKDLGIAEENFNEAAKIMNNQRPVREQRVISETRQLRQQASSQEDNTVMAASSSRTQIRPINIGQPLQVSGGAVPVTPEPVGSLAQAGGALVHLAGDVLHPPGAVPYPAGVAPQHAAGVALHHPGGVHPNHAHFGPQHVGIMPHNAGMPFHGGLIPHLVGIPQAAGVPQHAGLPHPGIIPQVVGFVPNASVAGSHARGGIGPAVAVIPQPVAMGVEQAGALPQIPYQELQDATNNWDQHYILGKGGFGTVFKGVWKYTAVAIKRIEQRGDNPDSYYQQIKQSITELYCLNAYRHDNILPLYGYCLMGPHPCLIYQFMPGGCLEQRLRTRDAPKFLNWTKRLSVAKGVARGLQFLHTIGDKPLIHGDIKSANILLDLNEEAKIGDFGLAREGAHSDYTHMQVSRIHGTRPYLPDEFLRSKQLSTKVDTYSFGVVMFEIGTGLSAYSDKIPYKFLRDYVSFYEGPMEDLIDRRGGQENQRYFLNFIEIGKVCVSHKAKDRPDMIAVLKYLEAV